MKRISGRAIIIHNDEIYLMFRRRNINGKFFEYYAIPGGKKEKNETIEECTIREIKEEFNIDIKIKKYLGIVEDDNNIGYIFNTEYISGEPVLGGEELEYNNEDNYYEVRKINIKDIDKIELLEENRELIKKAYQENNLI